MNLVERIKKARSFVFELTKNIIAHAKAIKSLCRFIEEYTKTHSPFDLLERNEIKSICKLAEDILVKIIDFTHELGRQFHIIMRELREEQLRKVIG